MYSMPLNIERFDPLDLQLCKFIGTKKSVHLRGKRSTATGLVWDINMATVTSRGAPEVIKSIS